MGIPSVDGDGRRWHLAMLPFADMPLDTKGPRAASVCGGGDFYGYTSDTNRILSPQKWGYNSYILILATLCPDVTSRSHHLGVFAEVES